MTGTIHIERDVPAAMPDGTVLRAEVWRPGDGEPRPAILVRTPYLKEFGAPLPVLDTRAATARGYAVVVQDVRGRGASDGDFEPFVNEGSDGAASVEWTAAQPWCDGRVVMTGMSYLGVAQWLAAAQQPPALRAIAPVLSSDELGDGWSYRSGVAEHGFLTTWSAADLAAPGVRWLDDPLRACDDAEELDAIAPWLAAWRANPPGSAFWRGRSVSGIRDQVTVPALHVGGWYDIFLAATIASFARSRHPWDRLLIGPWGHDGQLSHLVGELNAGIAGTGALGFFDAVLDFFDAVLARREPAAGRVHAYLLGARRWRELPSWPPPEAAAEETALAPGTFGVDPADPVPALGGRGLLIGVPGWGFGARDHRPLTARDDVHVALSGHRPSSPVLAGPVRAQLALAPGAGAERLWVATLCVCRPTGEWHNVCEGVARSAHGSASITVELGDVFLELGAGETLALLVAGSSFPRWPRPAGAGTQRVLAGSSLQLTLGS